MIYLNTSKTMFDFEEALKLGGNENLFHMVRSNTDVKRCVSTHTNSIYVLYDNGIITVYGKNYSTSELEAVTVYIRNVISSRYVHTVRMNEGAKAIMEQVNVVMNKNNGQYIKYLLMKKCELTKPFGDIKPLDKEKMSEVFIQNIKTYSGLSEEMATKHYGNIKRCCDIYGIIECTDGLDDLACQCYTMMLPHGTSFVCGVFTKECFRNMGLATALANSVSNRLLECNSKEVFVDVKDNNVPAIKAYMDAGFSLCDTYYEYEL